MNDDNIPRVGSNGFTVEDVDVHELPYNAKITELNVRKEEIKRRLAAGEIDGLEYNREMIQLMVPVEKKEPIRSRKSKKLTTYLIVLVLALTCIPGIIYISWRLYFENTLSAEVKPDYISSNVARSSVDSEPIQKAVTGIESGTYKGRDITINYKYYYDIAGVVTSVHDYWGFDDYATLVPRDVCMAWGGSMDGYYAGTMKFSQATRHCSMEGELPSDTSEIVTGHTSLGRTTVSVTSVSNNHLIPSTAEIRNQILSLRAGEKIRIIGYLVTVSYGSLYLDSSVVREDGGNGACEVIYVMKIEKLD